MKVSALDYGKLKGVNVQTARRWLEVMVDAGIASKTQAIVTTTSNRWGVSRQIQQTVAVYEVRDNP